DLKAVKAVAADGYTVNYDLSQIEKPDVLVAYAQADGPLTEEDGAFRMVLPEEEGKLNVRMLVEIQVVQ
ncbi:MAG: molybdopterin-dependent oxidoreductase, partial [Anaerolineales bacterium]|nr:molybdopterin-dependent oxidoreductase [Anaerolineales bacterium]